MSLVNIQHRQEGNRQLTGLALLSSCLKPSQEAETPARLQWCPFRPISHCLDQTMLDRAHLPLLLHLGNVSTWHVVAPEQVLGKGAGGALAGLLPLRGSERSVQLCSFPL